MPAPTLMSIQTLLSPLSSKTIRAYMVASLIALGIPADQWIPGGVASSLLTITASQFASFQNLMVQAIGASFLNTSAGQWLILLAYYVYGVTAPQATFASGLLVLTNTGGGIYTYAPFTASFQDPTTNNVFQNVTAISLIGPSTQAITIQCTVAGAVGNAAPGGVTKLVTSMLGVTATNPASVIGLNAISDVNLRQLCINKLGVLSVRGPKTAYQYAVTTALGLVSGLPVNINRSTISASTSTGVVSVYVASPSGPAASDDVLGVAANIAIVAQPDAVTVNVFSAVGVNDTDTITAWVNTNGVPVASLLTAVQNALITLYENYPIGGRVTDAGSYLFATGKDGAIGQAIIDAGATIVSVDGTNDLPLTIGQVAVNATAVTIRATS